jgi:putative ABC transport system permease protein
MGGEMRYDLKIAWRDLSTRRVTTLVAIAVISVAIALSVAVTHLNDALQRGIVRASDPFGMLVVGAKGSAQQLVMSTLLLESIPVGNIPHTIHDALLEDERVSLAVPIAMGDNYGGSRIIGTDERFFELSPGVGEPPSFQLEEGRLFEADLEAVVGSRAAREQGLAVGDSFSPAHGVEAGLEEDVHEEAEHIVVGILRPSNTAFDDAILTSVSSVNAVHGAHAQDEDDHAAGEVHEDEEGLAVTAILVRPTGFAEANLLWQDYYSGNEAQAVFPGAELGGIFDLLDQAQELLLGVGWLAAFMAALTLFLAVFSAGAARERLLAIMRALGASRFSVSRVVLLESVLIALVGAIVGRVLGYVVAFALAGQIAGDSAVPVSIAYLPSLEVWLWLLPLAVGLIAGAIPAWQAYRSNVLERLYPG